MSNNASSRGKGLLAKIHSTGYCCLKGCLELRRANGESAYALAEDLDVSPDTIWHHYRRLKQGKLTCQQQKNCLAPVIAETEKGP